MKTDDFYAVPLCPAHHQRWHAQGEFAGYSSTESQAILDRAIIALLREALLTNLELEE